MNRHGLPLFILLGLFVTPSLSAEEPISIARATPLQVQEATGRAIHYLQAESAAWLRSRECAACHHAGMPLWALSEAAKRGYTIDSKYLADTFEALLGSKEKLLATRIFPNPAAAPDPRPEGKNLNMGLAFLAVAARSWPSLEESQKQSLNRVTEEIIAKQLPDGSWGYTPTARRPPINENQRTEAVWIMMALQYETGADMPVSYRDALSKATAWFDTLPPPELQQEKALDLILAERAGKPRETLQPLVDALLALQRPDGGWSQTIAEPRSDAFATGQTLYALSVAGVASDEPEMQRGIDFLVATQLPDGSWPMIPRIAPEGSAGISKLLTPLNCAAASWATLALTHVQPVKP